MNFQYHLLYAVFRDMYEQGHITLEQWLRIQAAYWDKINEEAGGNG